MECSVEWHGPDGMLLVSKTGSNHIVTMDASPETGGNNLAARPMELMLSSTGGCISIEILNYLSNEQLTVSKSQVKIKAERAKSKPRTFTSIHFDFIISGKALPKEIVERAVKESHEKYCAAIAMLNKTAQMSFTVKIQES